MDEETQEFFYGGYFAVDELNGSEALLYESGGKCLFSGNFSVKTQADIFIGLVDAFINMPHILQDNA